MEQRAYIIQYDKSDSTSHAEQSDLWAGVNFSPLSEVTENFVHQTATQLACKHRRSFGFVFDNNKTDTPTVTTGSPSSLHEPHKEHKWP